MATHALNKLPLGDDLIDHIFTLLPSFEAFRSFLLCCKAIHQVYLRYPESIVRAVAYNVAGPALPQAMRLVKYRQIFQLHNRHLNPDTHAELPDAPKGISPITPLDARELTKIASVAVDLEHQFSRLHKDRHFKTSRLNSVESWRFRRAIYRISLFSAHFATRYDNLEDDREDEVLKSCIAFVDAVPDREIFEMRTVMFFLKDLAEHINTAAEDEYEVPTSSFQGFAFMRGPAMILAAISDDTTSYIPNFMYEEIRSHAIVESDISGFLDTPITHVLKERKLKAIDDRPQIWREILDEIVGLDDKCELCHQVFGLDLWSDCNWDLLRGTINASSMMSLLKGRLSQSPAGVKFFVYISNNRYSPILRAIFGVPQFSVRLRPLSHYTATHSVSKVAVLLLS